MAVEDPGLNRQAGRLRAPGAQILLLGGALALVGLVVALIGGADVLARVLLWFAVVPTIAGAGLLAAALVADRASRQKPFA